MITFGGYAVLFILVLGGFGLAALVDPQGFDSGDSPVMMIAAILGFTGWALFGFTYRVWMHAAKGKTLGKMAVRVRLVNAADGSAPGWGTCFVRELVHAVLAWTLIGFFLDLLWPLWDDRRQTLHDKAAKTLVVPG